MKLCIRGNSLGIQTTNTPHINTIVCFDLPDFKGGGEASSHPRHSDNKLHRGRASGTPSEGKLHEHEQTCHSDCPWYHLQVPTKNSQQKHFFCTSSLQGGHDGSLLFVTYQAKQHYISSFFPPRQENLEGSFFFLLPINTLSWHLFVFYIIACCWWRSSL